MDFNMTAELPVEPAKVWPVMIDIAEMTACIPGVESVEEKETLKLYSAVMKQKLGPFKLEVPAEMIVDELREPEFVRAHASGKDKFTRTTLRVDFDVSLKPDGKGGSLLAIVADLQVAGKLASLGHSMIKKKAEENFAEFETKFRARLERI